MARLPAGAEPSAASDEHLRSRLAPVHIPLLTNPGVSFLVGTIPHRHREGVAFELNNSLPHEVLTKATHRGSISSSTMPRLLDEPRTAGG